MDICFEGIGQMVATFAAKEELVSGMAVTLTDSGEVGLGEGNTPLCGVTVGAARDGAVAVQIGGVVKVGYADDNTPKVGYLTLACDGNGGVTTADDTNGVKCLVLAVDEVEIEDEGKNKKSIVIKL